MEDIGGGFWAWDTTWTTVGDSLVFYFLTTPSWDNYLDFRETVPLDCDNSMEIGGWEGDRALIVPSKDTVLYHKFSSCETPVGIAKKNVESFVDLNVFPNPCKGILNIDISSFSNESIIEVLDITGKTVKNFKSLSKDVSIDLSDMPSNVYFIKVTDNKSTAYRKVMLQ